LSGLSGQGGDWREPARQAGGLAAGPFVSSPFDRVVRLGRQLQGEAGTRDLSCLPMAAPALCFAVGQARITIEVEAPLRHVRVSYHPIIWNQNTPKIATLLIIWNQNTPKSRHFWPKRVRGRAAMWQRRGTANTTCVRLRDGRLARRFAASLNG
jgi:hypothetical protein